MKVTLESTEKIAMLERDGRQIPARVWVGKTENGVECFAYVTRIACRSADDATEFERDLQEHMPEFGGFQNIPLHLII